jgi:hypothetical protein
MILQTRKLPSQAKFPPSQMIFETRKGIDSGLSISLAILDSQTSCQSLLGRIIQIAHSISFTPSSILISFAGFSISLYVPFQSKSPYSQIILQTRKLIRSDLHISVLIVNSQASCRSLPGRQSQIEHSNPFHQSSMPISFAIFSISLSIPRSQSPLPRSQTICQTGKLFRSEFLISFCFNTRDADQSQTYQSDESFVSLSVSIAQTLSFLSIETRPLNGNSERVSHQWPLSNNIKRTIIYRFESESFRTSNGFRTNLFLVSLSDFHSILLPTMKFLSDSDRDLKASVGSVKITSGEVGGGFIALIAIACVGCLLYRRRSGQNRPQPQPEVFDEFDLPFEHREEEEENPFDLEDEKDSDDQFDSESFERNPVGRDLGMHFDGEESFASFVGWKMETRVNSL